ncbi:ThiF family adenylyltransferase [Novosphingobium sp. ERN07]|uniref:ThiF family adenylyltransferase n=1 Tax=Novosphingobium sp. ERN07 TaxID=2726187 RepID=UPI001457532E|nr:ThiF family adenylyltransferase [Novosphingobium sp. ERN07]NLR73469.1 ThiF family adenylyltransferase [Novosphingobium sp. ERN07]
MSISLTLTEDQHRMLRDHLFPGDGKEAVALLLCGRAMDGKRVRLIVNDVHLIPYDICSRTSDSVTWPTDILPDLLDRAARRGLSLVKIHGHEGVNRFSETDDVSDRELSASISAWADGPHGSAVMLDGERIFGRLFDEHGGFPAFDRVLCVGDDIRVWDTTPVTDFVPEHGRRIAQSFGAGTFAALGRLRIGVVGCSGTGSVVIDQLARNCVGELVLVDPDRIEPKNLNRIVNSRLEDAEQQLLKVDVMACSIEELGFGTRVETWPVSLFDPNAIRAIASCDIVFGCMDSIDGRHLLNRLASFYGQPYFDLGVKLEADGVGGVDQVCGTVHYLKPGGSSLFSRHVYSIEQVRVAGLMRADPAQYRALRREGYIKGVEEDRPAVIQLNSLIASLAVNELLARLHPYRLDPNADYAVHRISLSHGIYEYEPDGEPCSLLARHVGRGDIVPLLDMPELSVKAFMV